MKVKHARGERLDDRPPDGPRVARILVQPIDHRTRSLIDRAHDEALEILTEHRPRLDEIAAELMEKETVEKEDLVRLLDGLVKRPQRPGVGAGVAVARRWLESPGGPGPRSMS